MGSFSREFTIRQLTPLIHFQSDEVDEGATLRATELKPKLDRFLCGRYQKAHGHEAVPKAWQIEGASGNNGCPDYYHLNYKAQIIPKGEIKRIKIGKYNFPMYFGNMGDGKDKNGVFSPDGLTLKITCLISDKVQREALLDFLSENLELFFLTHNFGTRQTKGYGGFLYCPEHSLEEQLALLRAAYPRFIYFELDVPIDLNEAALDKRTEWAAKTDLVSMAMKSGWNRGHGNYLKGCLMTCGDGNNDKAMMKSKFGIGSTRNGKRPGQRKGEQDEYVFKRAVLGLAGTYTFRQVNPPAAITVSHEEQDEKKKIDRFPSPVLVKVLPNAVCFLPEDAKPILNQKFEFRFADEANWHAEKAHTEVIRTPAVFDVEKFLTYFAGWYNQKNKNHELGAQRLASEIHLEVYPHA